MISYVGVHLTFNFSNMKDNCNKWKHPNFTKDWIQSTQKKEDFRKDLPIIMLNKKNGI